MRRLPETGDDWQLYTGSMACEQAAKSLTAALKRAEKGLRAGQGSIEEMYKRYIYQTAKKYEDKGALDTEPRGVALSYLDAVAEELYTKMTGRKP